jgi:hypothetical protein
MVPGSPEIKRQYRRFHEESQAGHTIFRRPSPEKPPPATAWGARAARSATQKRGGRASPSERQPLSGSPSSCEDSSRSGRCFRVRVGSARSRCGESLRLGARRDRRFATRWRRRWCDLRRGSWPDVAACIDGPGRWRLSRMRRRDWASWSCGCRGRRHRRTSRRCRIASRSVRGRTGLRARFGTRLGGGLKSGLRPTWETRLRASLGAARHGRS